MIGLYSGSRELSFGKIMTTPNSNMPKPLSNAKINASVTIIRFSDEPFRKKLMKYGLFINKSLKVTNRYKNGSVIIGCDNFRLALDASIAAHILVTEEVA